MKRPYPINPILKYVVKVWMFFFTRYYNIYANASNEIRQLNEPYLLLANHYGRYDPFIISYIFKKRPNFISSDAILRDQVIGRLFKGLGAMPKKKGMRDSVIIREMLKVIQAGGALALFPEGGRTWDGRSLHIDPSIAKLVRLLKVPVISAKMQGAYLYDPRWATSLRQARMDIDYNILLSKEEIITLSEEVINERIRTALYHDDIAYQQQQRIEIKSERRSEQLEKVLFLCPDCQSYDGYTAKGNQFHCLHCGAKYVIDKYGFFAKTSGEGARFDNTRDWLDWQNREFVAFIGQAHTQGSGDPLFEAKDMKIGRAKGYDRISALGVGKLEFYIDRIEIVLPDQLIPLYFKDMLSIGAQFQERIELFYGDNAYKFENTKHSESGLKWELAVNTIWAISGEEHKVAAYFTDLFSGITKKI